MTSDLIQTWSEFFDLHAPHYDENGFTKNTLVEVQFLLEVMDLDPGATILDVGCGTGRHSIELAKRGYRVTGVDFSPGMLAVAAKKAQDAGVEVEWIHADATQFVASEPFDAAICLCEGAFGLVGHDEDAVAHDLAILRNINAGLKTGAPFVLTALNGYALIRRMKDEDVEAGAFDPASMIARYADEMVLPEGKRVVQISERLFIPPELNALMFHAGFDVLNLWGGTAGDWGKRPLKLDEIEMMAFARKRA